MNNNIEIRNELINTIRKMLKNNSILKKKLIANKELKTPQITRRKEHFFIVSLLFYIFGVLLFCCSFFDHNGGANLRYLALLPIGWLLNRIGSSKIVFPDILYSTIDNDDYVLLHQAGNNKEKEIIEFYKYLREPLTYGEVGL